MTFPSSLQLIRSGKFHNFVTLLCSFIFLCCCSAKSNNDIPKLKIKSKQILVTTGTDVGVATAAASYFIYRNDPFALLSGTLRTYQKAACDDEWLSLRCPTSTTLSIQLAQYGKVAPSPALCSSSSGTYPDLMDDNQNVTCLWPSAIQRINPMITESIVGKLMNFIHSIQVGFNNTVVGLCQKKASCKFQTSPRTFGGDPCPGSRKYVEVAYKCRPSEFKSVIGCQDEVIQLKCNASSRLAIYSANFGRTEYESVQCPQPKGVPEESCLSSYATETVMQMCHGKRKCALGANPATFGNPCKPESRMYLKVIHTCVPRKVLKEKYQGEPEPDEMFEDENEEESGDNIGGVLEQPSIYSPDHSKGWINPKTTTKPHPVSRNHTSEASRTAGDVQRDANGYGGSGKSQAKSAAVLNGNLLESNENSINHVNVKGNKDPHDGFDIRLISLVSQGVQAYDFISKNQEKFYLYVGLSVVSGLLMLLFLILIKVGIQRHRGHCCGTTSGDPDRGPANCTSSKPSSSSVGPLTSGLSDIDDLSVGINSNDIVDLHSMLRRSTPGDELFPLASGSATTTLGRNGEVVRFSNSRSSDLMRHPDECDTNLPKSLNLNRDSANLHFYYG